MISYRGMKQDVEMLRRASTVNKNRDPTPEILAVRSCRGGAGRLMWSESRGGFTIIELLLATVVFSAVVVVALSGFLTIGRLFYKGVNLSQTQATAQQIIDNLTTDIQGASTVWDTLPPASGGRSYVCIGNNRYIIKLYNFVDILDHNNTDKFGLLRDKLPGGNNACPNPYDGIGAVAPNNPTEMLGNKMRLNSFSVTRTCPTCKLFVIKVNLAYGDDSSLSIDPTTKIASCDSNLASSQYCAVTGLSTTVASGL